MAHNSIEELNQKVINAEKLIPKNSRWIHYKDTNAEHPYLVLGLALEEASEEVVVCYRREDHPKSFSWTRPLNGEKGWLNNITIEGQNTPRFRKIS